MGVSSKPTSAPIRRRPAWLRALGHDEPPQQIRIAGKPYELVRKYKHDSWAATSLYEDAEGQRAIVKMSRRSSLFGLPMRWAGKLLTRKERRVLQAMVEAPGIPRDLGMVEAEGENPDTIAARQYIAGVTLDQHKGPVRDDFFDMLDYLLSTLHREGFAYVDMNKADNILVGDDGRPYLIDYQIHHGKGVPMKKLWWPARMVLKRFQVADRYHLAKHKLRYRPDLYPGGEAELDRLRPWSVRVHRAVTRWPQRLRRGLLVKLRVRDRGGRADSELPADGTPTT